MWLLLACAPVAPSGAYSFTFAAPTSDCTTVPSAPDTALALVFGDGVVDVHPLGDTCPLVDDTFACELAAWDSDADHSNVGIDAHIRVDLDLEGDTSGAGELRLTTTCEGAECDAAVPGPERCTTTWAWTSVLR